MLVLVELAALSMLVQSSGKAAVGGPVGQKDAEAQEHRVWELCWAL